jgi:hypothetical protein
MKRLLPLLFLAACTAVPPPAPMAPPPQAPVAAAPTTSTAPAPPPQKAPRTYCQGDENGIFTRAEEFKKLSCPAYRKAIGNAVSKESATPLLWFCWVMDPCGRK